MSQPYNYYVGDGATVAFEFTQELNLKATVIGLVNYAAASGSYSTGTGFFTFDTAPADGADVHIMRATDQNVMVATFPNKSYISSDNLDANNRQLINLAEENAFYATLGLSYSTAAAASAAAAAASAAAAAVSAAAAAADAILTAADVVLTNADVVSTNADVVSTNADVTYAAEWAVKAEDSLISVAAGGDGVTDYSSLHWAAKTSAMLSTKYDVAGGTIEGAAEVSYAGSPIFKVFSPNGGSTGIRLTSLSGGDASIDVTDNAGAWAAACVSLDSSGVATFTSAPISSSAASGATELMRKGEVDTAVNAKQDALTDVGTVEFNTNGSGDRNSIIDLHSDDTNTDYSARLIRAAGVSGGFSMVNADGPIYFATDDSTAAMIGTDKNVTAYAAAPTAAAHLTRKDYVDGNFVADTGGTMSGDLVLTDSTRIRLGSGGDCNLSHDGSDALFSNATGELLISSAGKIAVDQQLQVANNTPQFKLNELDAALDEKFWRHYASAGTYVWDIHNDVNDTAVQIATVTRTGIVLGDITINPPILATAGIDKLTTATGVVSVAASAAPSNGDVLVASSATVAAWQAPSAGSWSGAQLTRTALLTSFTTGNITFTVEDIDTDGGFLDVGTDGTKITIPSSMNGKYIRVSAAVRSSAAREKQAYILKNGSSLYAQCGGGGNSSAGTGTDAAEDLYFQTGILTAATGDYFQLNVTLDTSGSIDYRGTYLLIEVLN
ncbi:MAG: hypothetical protein GY799_18880 [Desulfobulbaceae bacterium]|nr:hypothetical protein [Desulfobulbaceae bacterium]